SAGITKNSNESCVNVICMSLHSGIKLGQRVGSGKIHPVGEQLATRAIIGHRMSLQPMLHLQTVFERPQKVVSIRELPMLTFGDQFTIGQTAQTDQRMRWT